MPILGNRHDLVFRHSSTENRLHLASSGHIESAHNSLAMRKHSLESVDCKILLWVIRFDRTLEIFSKKARSSIRRNDVIINPKTPLGSTLKELICNHVSGTVNHRFLLDLHITHLCQTILSHEGH